MTLVSRTLGTRSTSPLAWREKDQVVVGLDIGEKTSETLKRMYQWDDRQLRAYGRESLQIWDNYIARPDHSSWIDDLLFIRYKRPESVLDIISDSEDEIGHTATRGEVKHFLELQCYLCRTGGIMIPHPLDSPDDLREIETHIKTAYHTLHARPLGKSAPLPTPGLITGREYSSRSSSSEVPTPTPPRLTSVNEYSALSRGEKRRRNNASADVHMPMEANKRSKAAVASSSTPPEAAPPVFAPMRSLSLARSNSFGSGTDLCHFAMDPTDINDWRNASVNSVRENLEISSRFGEDHDDGETRLPVASVTLSTSPSLPTSALGDPSARIRSMPITEVPPHPIATFSSPLGAISTSIVPSRLTELAGRQNTDYTTEPEGMDALSEQMLGASIESKGDPPDVNSTHKWFKLTRQEGIIRTPQGAFEVLKDSLADVKKATEDLGGYRLKLMKTPLMRIQVYAVATIWSLMNQYEEEGQLGRGFLLADETGLGKTTVALSVIVRNVIKGRSQSVLILCPAGIEKSTWMREMEIRTEGLLESCSVVDSMKAWLGWKDKRAEADTRTPRTEIVVVPFQFLRRYVNRDLPDAYRKSSVPGQNIESVLDIFNPDSIIIDEGTNPALLCLRSRLKEYADNLVAIVQNINGNKHILGTEIVKLCQKASFTLLTSATPFQSDHKQADLTLKMIGADADPSSINVETHPAKRAGRTRKGDFNRLMDRMKGNKTYMCRSKADPLHGKPAPVREFTESCEATAGQARTLRVLCILLSAYLDESLESADTTIIPSTHPISLLMSVASLLNLSPKIALAAMDDIAEMKVIDDQRLRSRLEAQSRQPEPCGKAHRLAELLRNQQNNSAYLEDKSLVLGWHERSLDVMVSAIETAGYVRWKQPLDDQPNDSPGYYVLHSPDMSRSAKNDALVALRDERKVKLFVGLIGALNEGHNLQMCNHMYLMELPRSPDRMVQLRGRIDRMPQTKLCRVIRLCTRDTVDELLENVIMDRQRGVGAGFCPILQYGDARQLLDIMRPFCPDRWVGSSTITRVPGSGSRPS